MRELLRGQLEELEVELDGLEVDEDVGRGLVQLMPGGLHILTQIALADNAGDAWEPIYRILKDV